MAAERGSAFLLKIGDGSVTPVYSTVAGLKTTQLSINGDAVAITNKGSGGWREAPGEGELTARPLRPSFRARSCSCARR